ncbi:MAG: DUF411 domain-containing protein [Gammaproteobacteria bacterium]|nr:DUF411 domain-containing protein [Gammaproteobacteria bacterium]
MRSIVAIACFFVTATALAGDPFWREGMTAERHEITVYRSETCGCCKAWIEHLEEHNFSVNDMTVEDVNAYKLKLKVPPSGASCHTAVVDGVVVEGHVPAQDIKRLLSSEHNTRLLTVPAMPSGTPGMDMPGAPRQDFKVFAVSEDDEVSVFNSYTDY